jgi:hypothetical protein
MRIAVVGLLIALAGCAVAPVPVSMTVPFSEADFQPWAGTGNASIRGQAFLKTVGGDPKTCAGQEVGLIPDNAYARELLLALQTGASARGNADPRVRSYIRKEICDAQGSFLFENIKPNEWIILARVTWGVPSRYGVNQQGGDLMKRIDVHPGENRVILTGADQIGP